MEKSQILPLNHGNRSYFPDYPTKSDLTPHSGFNSASDGETLENLRPPTPPLNNPRQPTLAQARSLPLENPRLLPLQNPRPPPIQNSRFLKPPLNPNCQLYPNLQLAPTDASPAANSGARRPQIWTFPNLGTTIRLLSEKASQTMVWDPGLPRARIFHPPSLPPSLFLSSLMPPHSGGLSDHQELQDVQQVRSYHAMPSLICNWNSCKWYTIQSANGVICCLICRRYNLKYLLFLNCNKIHGSTITFNQPRVYPTGPVFSFTTITAILRKPSVWVSSWFIKDVIM